MSELRDRSSEVVAAHAAGAGAVAPLTVSGEVVAGVLLVDLPTMSVVHADQGGLAMLPDRHLPVPLDRWGEDAGLVGVDGQPLTGADAMSAVALGEGRRGVMVQRRAERAPGRTGPEHPGAVAHRVPAHGQHPARRRRTAPRSTARGPRRCASARCWCCSRSARPASRGTATARPTCTTAR